MESTRPLQLRLEGFDWKVSQTAMHPDLCAICCSTICADGAALVCSEVCHRPPQQLLAGKECPRLHRACLSKYLLIRAEEGKFPSTCPFCLRSLSLHEVHKNLSPRSCRAWLRLHKLWHELRECPESKPEPVAVREMIMMQDLGYKRCPACGVWIEKQEPGWLTGCDKMTCRCGGRGNAPGCLTLLLVSRAKRGMQDGA